MEEEAGYTGPPLLRQYGSALARRADSGREEEHGEDSLPSPSPGGARSLYTPSLKGRPTLPEDNAEQRVWCPSSGQLGPRAPISTPSTLRWPLSLTNKQAWLRSEARLQPKAIQEETE